MGGTIDWTALPIVADMQGVDDIELLAYRLAAIRDWQEDNRG